MFKKHCVTKCAEFSSLEWFKGDFFLKKKKAVIKMWEATDGVEFLHNLSDRKDCAPCSYFISHVSVFLT